MCVCCVNECTCFLNSSLNRSSHYKKKFLHTILQRVATCLDDSQLFLLVCIVETLLLSFSLLHTSSLLCGRFTHTFVTLSSVYSIIYEGQTLLQRPTLRLRREFSFDYSHWKFRFIPQRLLFPKGALNSLKVTVFLKVPYTAVIRYFLPLCFAQQLYLSSTRLVQYELHQQIFSKTWNIPLRKRHFLTFIMI